MSNLQKALVLILFRASSGSETVKFTSNRSKLQRLARGEKVAPRKTALPKKGEIRPDEECSTDEESKEMRVEPMRSNMGDNLVLKKKRGDQLHLFPKMDGSSEDRDNYCQWTVWAEERAHVREEWTMRDAVAMTGPQEGVAVEWAQWSGRSGWHIWTSWRKFAMISRVGKTR